MEVMLVEELYGLLIFIIALLIWGAYMSIDE